MREVEIGVLGGRSFICRYLLARVQDERKDVLVLSRGAQMSASHPSVVWRSPQEYLAAPGRVAVWISLLPISELPAYLPLVAATGVRRVVALSTTSIMSKSDSDNAAERELVARCADAERALQAWAASLGIEWVVLRPTMVYGGGLDRNVALISRFVRRWRFFPLLGTGRGLRQPVHADDVAAACLMASRSDVAPGKVFVVSGGEVLDYREMVTRIGAYYGLKVWFLRFPVWLFACVLRVARMLPRYRGLNASMARRMEKDLVFSHDDAKTLLSFSPRGFVVE